jgi:hypothetical protein
MRALLLIAALLASAAGATEVYRWIDDQGQAHYSDRWMPGAEKVQLEAPSVFGAPQPPRPAGAALLAAPGFRYQSVQILSPAQEEVLWNIEGQLPVSVQVTPNLQPGHSIQLYLDNEPVAELAAGSDETQLQNVFRGVHTLKAEVTDGSGKVLITGQTVTFAVRQTSIANPQNPVVQPR